MVVSDFNVIIVYMVDNICIISISTKNIFVCLIGGIYFGNKGKYS